MSGHLIAIVGTSSIGKSSASARLQEMLPDPYLTVGIDHFLNMFPQQWAGQPRGPGPGMWYEDCTDPDGALRARIRYGQAGSRLLAGMQASVRAMLDCGNNIILDEMPLDETIVPQWKRTLASYRTYWVHLSADLEVVEAREAQRKHGQHIGNARGHFGISDREGYDLKLDVAAMTPVDVANSIKQASLRHFSGIATR
ncbi:phosphotransferase-like protein [Brachybacterium tyrofermentans]|uniref:phosphotransferase-like protein n=1 Tax=Brachybacterium tyrofermentans TaxID=47848 RepID=UPI003FD59FF7